MNRAISIYVSLLFAVFMMAGCMPFAEREAKEKYKADRHYGEDYNFILVTDSIVLQEDRPMHLLIMPETTDSMVIYKSEPLVVAQIEIIPEDSIDSVWVKVARDQMTQGWIHESQLLEAVVPDDPISQGIRMFSRGHLAAAFLLCLLVISVWLIWDTERRRFRAVHIIDIASPYPMLLCLSFTLATVLYTSILIFVPEAWLHFYFHPTLNPFGQSVPLAVFLTLVWLIIVLFIAAIDEICRSLNPAEAVFYILSLIAVLAGLCLLFSFATQYFIGYFLWAVYAIAAVVRYLLCHRARYRCMYCDAPLHDNGQCPHCHANMAKEGR